jgi:methenyltetrahydrofolate cyclohydrolase
MSELSSSEFGTLLQSVAAKSPTPGGGAVASAVGALAASLGSMVVSFSIGKKSLAAHAEALGAASGELARAREVLLRLADEDAAAYASLNAVWKLDKADPTRDKRMAAAAELALAPPMAVIATCTNLLRLLESLCDKSNRSLLSDLAIAAVLADAAVRGSRWNVLVNLPLLASDDARREIRAELEREIADAAARAATIDRACLSAT